MTRSLCNIELQCMIVGDACSHVVLGVRIESDKRNPEIHITGRKAFGEGESIFGRRYVVTVSRGLPMNWIAGSSDSGLVKGDRNVFMLSVIPHIRKRQNQIISRLP